MKSSCVLSATDIWPVAVTWNGEPGASKNVNWSLPSGSVAVRVPKTTSLPIVGLMMNVHRNQLQEVISSLPALQTPTVSHLSDPDWVAVNTIVDESIVRSIIPQLKQSGARGIVEYPISKIID